MTDVTSEMPRYKSHKEVRAFKIGEVEINRDGPVRIRAVDEPNWLTTPMDWASRYHGDDDDFGYYVLYADGYESWSPTKAFEDGYTLIE